ncbi:MAG: alpha/beta hydrolase [Rhizobiaceae bacterium]
MTQDSYLHRIEEGRAGGPLLFVFHGTGADENQLVDVARQLMPEATIVSPRGDVSENGAARFFKRTGEGVYDMEDLAERTQKMAAFVKAHVETRKPSAVLGLGYSNGANILATVAFAQPGLFAGAVLMHPLIPFEPEVAGTLEGRSVLITAGQRDPICPAPMTESLAEALKRHGATVETAWHEGGHEVRPEEFQAARTFLAEWS